MSACRVRAMLYSVALPLKLTSTDPVMTFKEVCFVVGWSRTTLWRRRNEGCPFVGGRINSTTLSWWIEQRDAARKLGMTVKKFLTLSRKRRERLLAKLANSLN